MRMGKGSAPPPLHAAHLRLVTASVSGQSVADPVDSSILNQMTVGLPLLTCLVSKHKGPVLSVVLVHTMVRLRAGRNAAADAPHKVERPSLHAALAGDLRALLLSLGKQVRHAH